MLPVLLSFLNNPMKHGTIINSVHHPSKNIFISVMSNAFKPMINPKSIRTNPHKLLLILFIFITSFFFYLYIFY